jgi:NAD(P)-dependent dehydrogenase (short-subunit alcohol dehydrogenase family)
MKHVLITGSSTGIGLATAIHLARANYQVYAGLRSPKKAEQLEAAIDSGLPIQMVQLDVNDDASVTNAVEEVRRNAGHIDVLVNNAGISGGGPLELVSIETAKQIFETNYFGAIRMIRAVLPQMRERKSGAIVNITSLAGRLVSGGSGHYSASKFALEAASEILAVETRPYGIRVAIIEPGVIATPIFSKGQRPYLDGNPYITSLRRMMKFFQAQLSRPTHPQAVSDVIQKVLESDSPKLRYVVGKDAELLLKMRQQVSDEDWIGSGLLSDDELFQTATEMVGVNLYTKSANAGD